MKSDTNSTNKCHCAAAARVLSLKECLEQGKANYPLIKAKATQVAGGRRLQSSTTEYLPQFLVDGQVNYGTNNSVNGAFYPNEGMSTASLKFLDRSKKVSLLLLNRLKN